MCDHGRVDAPESKDCQSGFFRSDVAKVDNQKHCAADGFAFMRKSGVCLVWTKADIL